MADEQSDPPNKRRRPPTTIDVKATEVASETPATPEAPDAAPESLASEPAEGSPSPSSEAAQPGGWRDRMNWRLAAACGAGAAAMLLVLLALWGAGVFQSEDQVTPRLARLEQHVLALENRPQPPAADPRAVADLSARVAAAEQALGRLSGLDARLTKAEAAAIAPRAGQPDQALAARVTALENAAQKTSPPAASLAEVQALAARVAALEQAAKAAEAKLAVTAGADRAGRLAFLSTALQLAAAKPLVTDAAALSALEPFAATGVPRNAALARDLAQLSGPMLSAAGKAPREGGILDRIQQNAERLVRIRPISETPGDDAATIVARAEAKASHGDIAGAVSELGALPPAVRAPAEPWIKKAQAQIAALAAAGKLADDALATLAKAAP